MEDLRDSLDQEACYRAVLTRDPRFDGRFFTCVKTTGIYCRPVCPARTPRRETMRFVASAAAAEEGGFRACLRCRPETAPDMGAWCGTSNTVSRGLALTAILYIGFLGLCIYGLVGWRRLRTASTTPALATAGV